MDTETALLDALAADPADDVGWLALADWLEEHDRSDQARLLRLHRDLRSMPEGAGKIDLSLAIQSMINTGVRPVGPRIVNSIGLELALIPAGTFVMGSADSEAERYDDEGPQHEVEITRPFYLGISTVTQAQYERVMSGNPSAFSKKGNARSQVRNRDTSSMPVETVTWKDAIDFCRRLSELPEELAAGRVYRLPTEAQWEYACRAWGSSRLPFHFGKTLGKGQAWFDWSHPYGEDENPHEQDYLSYPRAVGQFPCNAFGLHDMHGNIDEWCHDWYARGYYFVSPRQDPQGPDDGSQRVLRGGSYFDDGGFCRTAVRYFNGPEEKRDSAGFRLACEWTAELRTR